MKRKEKKRKDMRKEKTLYQKLNEKQKLNIHAAQQPSQIPM